MGTQGHRRRIGFERWAGIVWLAIAQFFIVELVVQVPYTPPYSELQDAISDLGAMHCTSQICSPWHLLMDASFVALGICIAAGAIAAELSSPRVSATSRIGAGLMALAGLGVVVVGLVPEDLLDVVHYTGAMFGILAGNAGSIVTGGVLWWARRHRTAGVIGIVAGALGIAGTLVLGVAFATSTMNAVFGLIERVAVYPMLLAMIVTGGTLLRGDWLRRRAQRRATTSRSAPQVDDNSRISTPKPWRRSSSTTSGSRKVR